MNKASELVRNFGEHSDSALTEPLIITRNGCDRLVLLNIEEYNALRHMVDMGEELGEAKAARSERTPR
jgi:PHD/YefM family antitoxin component YafN of YafNO toxin-antitoxin module